MVESMIKHAAPDHPIHELIATRWSPYLFDPRPVEREKLLSCLEAARWAPSSYNEQPWRFIVARREDEAAFEAMLGCLVEANQSWAKNAGVLMLTVAKKTFTKNGKPNRVAIHDIGLAAGSLTLQATQLGLDVHQMAGINPSKARQTYSIPDDFEPVTGIALGYGKDPDDARGESERALAERDRTPRERRPLAETVFEGDWGKSLGVVKG